MTGNIYNIKIKNVYGEETSLKVYQGKKILIVNVASNCGYTNQYKDLQQLQDQYGDKLQVIAFPCNDFGSQEPGTDKQIAQFCESNYNVKFPVMSKINIRSKPIHPIYKWLSTSELNGWNDSKPRWNFYKYLIDENGNLVKSFGSSTSPLSSEIIQSL
ncbi:glutathione peroxidase [bacterium]|jgi:glutathione peroxidase|nr:glutathione peroxidase [bacterium]MBT4926715.1 glutathione peroxidase [bacterium]MBT5735028.1 glutathione peroxidase [bacterium]MBT6017923.1 glutathione peroxidase [bacterium]MBT6777977.1 glutathione peroxidase [bacterium]